MPDMPEGLSQKFPLPTQQVEFAAKAAPTAPETKTLAVPYNGRTINVIFPKTMTDEQMQSIVNRVAAQVDALAQANMGAGNIQIEVNASGKATISLMEMDGKAVTQDLEKKLHEEITELKTQIKNTNKEIENLEKAVLSGTGTKGNEAILLGDKAIKLDSLNAKLEGLESKHQQVTSVTKKFRDSVQMTKLHQRQADRVGHDRAVITQREQKLVEIEKKITPVLIEIQTTESTFVDGLERCVTGLNMLVGKDGVIMGRNESDFLTNYSNDVKDLKDAASALNTRIGEANRKERASDRLQAMAEVYTSPAFAKYSNCMEKCAQNYDEAQTIISHLRGSNPKAAEKLNEFQKILVNDKPNQNLNSYMILPVQRMPRHELFSKEMQKQAGNLELFPKSIPNAKTLSDSCKSAGEEIKKGGQKIDKAVDATKQKRLLASFQTSVKKATTKQIGDTMFDNVMSESSANNVVLTGENRQQFFETISRLPSSKQIQVYERVFARLSNLPPGERQKISDRLAKDDELMGSLISNVRSLHSNNKTHRTRALADNVDILENEVRVAKNRMSSVRAA